MPTASRAKIARYHSRSAKTEVQWFVDPSVLTWCGLSTRHTGTCEIRHILQDWPRFADALMVTSWPFPSIPSKKQFKSRNKLQRSKPSCRKYSDITMIAPFQFPRRKKADRERMSPKKPRTTAIIPGHQLPTIRVEPRNVAERCLPQHGQRSLPLSVQDGQKPRQSDPPKRKKATTGLSSPFRYHRWNPINKDFTTESIVSPLAHPLTSIQVDYKQQGMKIIQHFKIM